jgi:hypothetical protein
MYIKLLLVVKIIVFDSSSTWQNFILFKSYKIWLTLEHMLHGQKDRALRILFIVSKILNIILTQSRYFLIRW